MIFKIEKNFKTKSHSVTRQEFKEFALTIKKLKTGESFVVKKLHSNYRNAVSIAKILLEIDFTMKKEGKYSYRIYRTK